MRVKIGKVGRPHGLEGAFFVEDASDDPQRFADGATLIVGGEPAQVVESKRAGGRPVIRLDREVPRGASIEVERSALPEPEENEFYAFQLVGLEVSSGPANDVLELDTGLALPLVDACVQKVELDAGRIVVEPGFSADS